MPQFAVKFVAESSGIIWVAVAWDQGSGEINNHFPPPAVKILPISRQTHHSLVIPQVDVPNPGPAG